MQHRRFLKRELWSCIMGLLHIYLTFIHACANRISNATSLHTKDKAIEQGIEFCVRQNYLSSVAETDSLAMKRIIEDDWKIPWTISMEMIRIQEWKKMEGITITHTREGNQVEDILVNIVFHFVGSINYTHFADLPTRARNLLNIYKQRVQGCIFKR